jgi:hypothetical protein
VAEVLKRPRIRVIRFGAEVRHEERERARFVILHPRTTFLPAGEDAITGDKLEMALGLDQQSRITMVRLNRSWDEADVNEPPRDASADESEYFVEWCRRSSSRGWSP